MPTFRFPLEVGGPKRLTITMPAFNGATLIDLDDQRVGVIPSKPALADGQAFALPDGRELHVAFEHGSTHQQAGRGRR